VESSDSEDESQTSDKSYETDESETGVETEEYYGEEPEEGPEEDYWKCELGSDLFDALDELECCHGDVQ
jgi:hypothetical protein